MNSLSEKSFNPGLRVVAMGGGTGLSTLLRGLKQRIENPTSLASRRIHLLAPYISDLTAIVAVTDDGGSSGRLRIDFGMLAPGDLRSCMIALAEDEHHLSRLFRHRFRAEGGLAGHSFGNLFIAALMEMTGSFGQAIQLAGEVLSIRGRILPVTAINATLVAIMEDGALVRGETKINASRKRIAEVRLEPELVPAPINTLEAIARADLITIGPGSLYTSIVTNILVQGIPEALADTSATRVYITNLMTEPNESLGLSVSEHIERIYEHAGRAIFDYAMVNTGPISEVVRGRYAAEGAEPTKVDLERIEAMGIGCICGDFVADGKSLRHASDQVAEVLLALKRVALSQRSESVSGVAWGIPRSGSQAYIPLEEGTAL